MIELLTNWSILYDNKDQPDSELELKKRALWLSNIALTLYIHDMDSQRRTSAC
jgi:hypothetical protein